MAPAAKTPVAKAQSAKNRVAKHAAKVDAKAGKAERKLAEQRTPVQYQPGFGNHFVTEAVAGALPVGRNSPQRPPLGLYAEQISGTSFTAPRAENRRTWTYRIRPRPCTGPTCASTTAVAAPPSTRPRRHHRNCAGTRFRSRQQPTDFVEGIVTLGGNGDVAMQAGMAVHLYAANRSMADRCFYNADGEMLIVPQQGRARFVTELGIIEAAGGEIAVMPRGLRFRVELPDGPSRGYVCENYGAMLRLPELGPLGANGLANPRDFLAPVAAFEDREGAVSWCRNSRAICGRPISTIRRSTSSRGTAISFPTNTISRASWSSARSVSTIPTRRSLPC